MFEASVLAAKIQRKGALVGVLGLGYVGLPLARAFCDSGFTVLGFDTDADKVAQLEAGHSYIGAVPSAALAEHVAAGRFSATSDFSRLAALDAMMICVPTPLNANREPDVRFMEATAQSIARTLRPGQLIVLESTTYPGTTSELIRPILEARSGLSAGEDFFLGYSPERENPGDAQWQTRDIPKVVGADDEGSKLVACALYEAVVVSVVAVSSTRAAEASKLLENIYRCVNIALVNELKVTFERMGIDVFEVINASKTKPFGFKAFYPGPGLGGHCLAGHETVNVRRAGKSQVVSLAELFEAEAKTGVRSIQGVEVIEPKTLEVQALDCATRETRFCSVSHLFRRALAMQLYEVRISGDRGLKVTDGHPMLVFEGEDLNIKRADALQPGDALAVVCAWPAVGDRVARGKVERIEPIPGETVYSLEVPETGTFVTTSGIAVHNCIPIDPFYLSWKAREHDTATRFIELAGEINTSMPRYVVERCMLALNRAGKAVNGARILVLGVAYKEDVDDVRESPALVIIEQLEELGARVSFHDPYVPALRATRKVDLAHVPQLALSDENLAAQDLVLIVTAHSSIDYRRVVAAAPLVVDTRNATGAIVDGALRSKIVRA